MPATPASTTCLVCSLLFPILAWIFLLLRLYTRQRLVRSIQLDDYAALFTTVLFTVTSGAINQTAYVASLTDMTKLPNLIAAARWLFASFNLYIVTSLSLKITLALFFLRLLPSQTTRPARVTIILATALFTLLSIVYFFLTLFDCGNPLHFLENQLANKCLPKDKVGIPTAYLHGAFNAATDWLFTLSPLLLIANLSMSRANKLALAALLALAVAGSVCSLARLAYIRLLNQGFQQLFSSAYGIGTMSVVEVGIGLVATSAGTLRPLVRRWTAGSAAGGHASSSSYSYGRSGASGGAGRGGGGGGGGRVRRVPFGKPGSSFSGATSGTGGSGLDSRKGRGYAGGTCDFNNDEELLVGAGGGGGGGRGAVEMVQTGRREDEGVDADVDVDVVRMGSRGGVVAELEVAELDGSEERRMPVVPAVVVVEGSSARPVSKAPRISMGFLRR